MMGLNLTGKRKQSAKNKLYEGVFNGQRKIYFLYCHAYSSKQARLNFCRQIAKKQDVPEWMVLQYFQKDKENYIIKEVDE